MSSAKQESWSATKTLRIILVVCIAAAIGVALGFLAVRLVGHPHSRKHDPTELAIALVCCFVIPQLVIALHEAGHLITGKIVGLKPELYVAGMVRWERGSGWGLNRDAKHAGGICMMIPVERENVIKRFALMIFGGPLFSLVGALLAYLAFVASTPSAPGIVLPLCFFAILSAAIGVVTLFPIQNGAYLNDGKRLLRLKSGGPLAERDVACLEIIACLYQGIPPAMWPEVLFDRLDIQDGSIFEGSLCYLAYMRALDLGYLDEADRYLDRAKKTMVGVGASFETVIQAEYNWFHAWYRGCELLELPIRQSGMSPGIVHRYNAAYQFFHGDVAGALITVDDAMRALADSKEEVLSINLLKLMREKMLGASVANVREVI